MAATYPLRAYLEMLVKEQLELYHPDYKMSEVSDDTGAGASLLVSEPDDIAIYPMSSDNEPTLEFESGDGKRMWSVNVEQDDSWAGIYYLLLSYGRVTRWSWIRNEEPASDQNEF